MRTSHDWRTIAAVARAWSEFPTDAQVEAAAQALWAHHQSTVIKSQQVPWSMTLTWEKDRSRDRARAALEAARDV